MGTGAITSYIDVPQLALYAFWIFFFLLVRHLHREGKREGWPLEVAGTKRSQLVEGFGGMPKPKTYELDNGQGSRTLPGTPPAQYELKAKAISGHTGAPLHPTGDPQVDGVGPAAWGIRPERPDLTVDGQPRIVPLRVDTEHKVNSRDPDPRGCQVTGCDGQVGGTVTDLWVDRAEPWFRYAEVDVGEHTVLLPMTMARVSRDGSIKVKSIRGDQFKQVPRLANPDQVTLQEEDKITAFYGGGTLYATPDRLGPWL
ncbi:MAG: photosynthetic reaction center subunit H [Halieaceae bacterium]|nr:photosynthetic reaction center subunit H [Halieaceae bacterium]